MDQSKIAEAIDLLLNNGYDVSRGKWHFKNEETGTPHFTGDSVLPDISNVEHHENNEAMLEAVCLKAMSQMGYDDLGTDELSNRVYFMPLDGYINKDGVVVKQDGTPISIEDFQKGLFNTIN